MPLPTIITVGNLTADPELRFTTTGKSVASLRVACSERKKDPAGQWVDGDKVFLNVNCWNETAENITATCQKGDTVVVSGAAGAVGSLAGQIARLSGASRVIGIAGGPHKTAFLVDELGFDAAIDYKNENVETRLGELAPNGVDVFFDNVGGDTLDAVLMHIKDGTRVVICGAISQYQDMDNVRGPKNYLKLAERHATMAGFAVFHFAEHYERAEKQLTQWLASGQLIMREHIEQGIDRFPAALNILQNGGHHGKLLVRVAETS